MDFKSLLSKIDSLQESKKESGNFEKLQRDAADRVAAHYTKPAKKSSTKKAEKSPDFDTSALASTLGGKLPKKPVGTVSRVHKTPDFEPHDEDDGSEIVREQDVAEGTQQPRNLKEWMNRVEGINETQVKAPISVIQGGKPVQATITSTSTNPTDTNVLQAAAEILKKGQGQIQMSPSQSATTPSTQTTQQSAKPSTIQSVQPVKEEELDEVAAPGQEDWIKSNKQRFIDQYGKKKGLSVLYATAWKRSKNKTESINESVNPIMDNDALEGIRKKFPHECKMYEDGWGVMDEGLYEALRDHYFENGFIPRKVMYGDSEHCRKHVMDCYNKDRGLLMDEGVQTASSGDAHFGPLEEIAPIAAIGAGLGAAAGEAGAAALGAGRLGTAALSAAGRVGGANLADKLFGDSDDTNESLYELDDLDDVDTNTDDSDPVGGEFPFPNDMEGEGSMSVKQMDDMKQDDLLDEEDYMMESKKMHKKVSEETKETKTGRVHKAAPGGYGRKDDEGDDGKKVKKDKDAPKRGRGRPKKDADSDGEVKKWDTETLARWIVGSKPDKLPGKTTVKHKIKDESAKKSKKMDAQMESWDRELKSLLNEGMTITTSTGQPGGMDSVSVSATDSDAQTLLRLLQDAGIGLGGKSSGMSSVEGTDGQVISVEPVAHDEVMGQLQPEVDSGDDALGFIKRMIGARDGDTAAEVDYEQEGDHDHMGHDEESCKECGHSPCECETEKVDEDEVEEGNAFTGALAKARADGVQAGEKMKVDGKEYPVKHGKKMDEEDEHDSDDHDSKEDDEEDEEEDKDKVDEGQQTCNECGGAMYEGHQCDSEKLDELSPQTLGSYREKALAQANQQHAMSGNPAVSGAGQFEPMSGGRFKQGFEPHGGSEAGKMQALAQKRFAGADQAKQKMTATEEMELNEWANSPMGKSADEDFKTEIEYMTKLISGGLNGQKRDQTTLPHTKVKADIIKEDISSTMKKLAGIK